MSILGALGRLFAREARMASIEDPKVPISDSAIVSFLGLSGASSAGEIVTVDSALGVPAVWAAVNFIPASIAGLPLHLYRHTAAGRERVRGPLATMLHDAVNDGLTSFQWRKQLFEHVLTEGRGITFIERAATGRVLNLWPLDPTAVTVVRREGRVVYEYREGARTTRYEAAEIIDLPFMLFPDGVRHRSPILTNRDVIGQAQAVTRYAAKYFANGGVPPFAIEGPFQSPGAVQRAARDLEEAVRTASRENRLALSLPSGHTIKPFGTDPEKSQMVEAQRFVIEQVARIYSLPPTFLQDLTHGTFANTEQQDLHFVKHTLRRWVEAFEQELNLKLFGRASARQYVELSVDGLLRGDFKTRMEAHALAVQNAIRSPNEVRELENMPAMTGGDALLIQGATVPLEGHRGPAAAPAPQEPADPPADDTEAGDTDDEM